MALPKSVSGSTYLEMHRKLVAVVSTANGRDETDAPRLSNGEALAILRAWRRAATRSKKPWSGWYELALPALGWAKAGDQFVMTTAQARAPYPAAEAVWNWTSSVARDLDDSKTTVNALPLDWSYKGYTDAAHEAWERMKLDGAGGGMPPLPDKPPQLPVPPLPVAPSFPWWLLLLVVGAAVAR